MPLFGLAVGSFLNLTIDRVPRGESIVSPSSKCARCERRLSPLDLVPLLSYLWLRGKCRFCGARIPLRNSFVEAAAGAMFLLVAYRFGLTTTTAVILAYSSLFIVIFAIDLERTIIPDVLVFPAVFIAFVAGPFGPVGEDRSLLDTLLHVAGGGALGFITMFLIYMVSYFAYKGSVGLGFGDVKLGALIGLVAGFPEIVVVLYFAFISGGVIAVLLLLLKLRGRREAIPYGPFLTGSTITVLLVGKDFGWYVGWFA